MSSWGSGETWLWTRLEVNNLLPVLRAPIYDESACLLPNFSVPGYLSIGNVYHFVWLCFAFAFAFGGFRFDLFLLSICAHIRSGLAAAVAFNARNVSNGFPPRLNCLKWAVICIRISLWLALTVEGVYFFLREVAPKEDIIWAKTTIHS